MSMTTVRVVAFFGIPGYEPRSSGGPAKSLPASLVL